MSTSQSNIQKSNKKSLSKNGELDLEHTLNKLSELLEEAIEIAKENRQIAMDHYYDEKQYLDESRKSMMVSEEGILEKNCTQSLKLLQEATSSLEGPITALTKILSTKMIANSSEIKGPVNIQDFKNHF